MRVREGELTTAADAALISQVRLGDTRAFEALAARHLPAMRQLADLLLPGADVDPLLDQSLETAFGTLRRMSGPTSSLRTFLLLLTRRLYSLGGHGRRVNYFALEPVFSGVPFRDHLADDSHDAVALCFSELPEGWQAAVWHLEAEAEPVDAVATVIGVAPAGIHRLTTSAREELRGSLVVNRTRSLPAPCLAHRLRLQRSKGTVPPRSVLKHAATCASCGVLVDDLAAVERDLTGVLARHLLGPVAEDYLGVRRERVTAG